MKKQKPTEFEQLVTEMMKYSATTSKSDQIKGFITESNKIEGITRPPTKSEVEVFTKFLELKKVTVGDLENFVSVYQPGAALRDQVGLNVRVGTHYPPSGGPEIKGRLKGILANLSTMSPYEAHVEYETLHPFTDGNGRSGRALWAWQMGEFPRGFLHEFYYQTLGASRK